MIKKIKLSLLITVLSLFVGASYAFATSALTFSDNTVITIGSHNYTILSGSEATSMVLATDGLSLAVEVPTSSTFTLVSPNRDTLTISGGGTATCTNTESTLVITGLTSTTRTFTPSTTACGAITSGSGTVVPPSGGGGSYTPPVVPATPVVPGEIPGCGNRTTGFSTVDARSCALNTSTTPATPASPSSGSSSSEHRTSFEFGTKTLKNGSKGEAVKELQRFLNQVLNLGLVVDGKLGPKTIAVIKKWQKENGLVADGLIGPKTKAMMNASVK